MEFHLSRLEKAVESMKVEFQKELDELKFDLHSIEENLNEIRVFHSLNSSIEEDEDKENKNVESYSHIEKIETHLGKVMLKSLTYDISLLQDPQFHGFNSTSLNYFIPKINMRMFDANYPLTWIFKKGNFFEIMAKQL